MTVDITPVLSFSYEGYTFTKRQKTHMDGAKALAYSWMRYDDPEGDYGRQKRQRQVLQALVKKAESAQPPAEHQLRFIIIQAGADRLDF